MKKYIYILITIFTFSLSINMVNALDITRWNACSGNTSSITNSGKCADQSSTANTNVKPKSSNIEHEETDDCGEKISYNIVILFDASGSMENGKKTEYAKTAVNNMLDTIKKLDENNKTNNLVKICEFGYEGGTSINCFGYDNFVDYNKFDDLKNNEYHHNQATDIRYALNQAGSYLDNQNNGKAPMVILITDGFPTCDKIAGSGNCLNNMSSAKYGYNVVSELIDLKSKLTTKSTNAKILTYNINEIMINDNLSEFILNPNSQTLNDISKDITKEAYTLYQMINGQEVYETFAGVWEKEDYGIYRGVANVNANGERTVTFTFPKDSTYEEALKSKNLNLFFPKNTTVKEIKIKKGNDTTTYCSSSSECENIKTGASGIDRYNLSNIDTKYKSCITENKCSLTITAKVSNLNPKDYTKNYTLSSITDNTIVDSSFSGKPGELSEKLSEEIKKQICNKSSTKTKDEVKKYNYDNCISKNVTISDIYYKTTEDYYGGINKNGTKYSAGSCIKVSGQVNYIMTENLKFTVGGLSSISPIYAGGGFTWSGTQVKNDITARFMYLYDNDSKPVLKNITTSYYNTSGNPATVDYVGISDLYTNLSCSNQLKISDIDKKIKESINENISDISNTFETLSSNDPNNLKEKIAVNTNKAKEKLDYKTDNQDLRYITSVTYSFSLKNACISKDGLTVRYTANNCNDNEIDGGNLRYTPLKYAKSSFNVNVNGNLSSIGIKFDIQASCPVGIKQILYECTDKNCDPSKLKIAYKYRSIDTNNPFPKNVIPSNWKTFMQNTANVNRLKNSYNALNYSYTFKNDNLDKITNGSSYTSWSGIKSSGTSDFVKKYFNTNFNTNKAVSGINYCPLGEFKESCNKR